MHFDLANISVLIAGLIIVTLLYVALHTDLVGDVNDKRNEDE